jgi:hypothetical protein
LVPIAGATGITAGFAGCDGVKPCDPGPYLLDVNGPQITWTFDYSIPNRQAREITSLDQVVVDLEVFDRRAGEGKDKANEGFTIYLIVGADYSPLALYTYGPARLDPYTGGDRLLLNEIVPDSALPAFLAALQGNRGDFGIEVVATTGNFWLGDRHGTPGNVEDPGRFVTLDFQSTPEPASPGIAGIGLIGICLALRKKSAR